MKALNMFIPEPVICCKNARLVESFENRWNAWWYWTKQKEFSVISFFAILITGSFVHFSTSSRTVCILWRPRTSTRFPAMSWSPPQTDPWPALSAAGSGPSRQPSLSRWKAWRRSPFLSLELSEIYNL